MDKRMDKRNVELSDIVPFKEYGQWYLKLIYKYEDKQGKHTVIIPKAAIPFNQKDLPSVHMPLYDKIYLPEQPYLDCRDSMLLYKKKCDLAIKRGVKDPYYYFDIITEYNTKEMTLDDIEKELGYKVKIVNKEKKDDV